MQNLDFLEELNEQQESSIQGGLLLQTPFGGGTFTIGSRGNQFAASLVEFIFPGSVVGTPFGFSFSTFPLTFGTLNLGSIDLGYADSITVTGA